MKWLLIFAGVVMVAFLAQKNSWSDSPSGSGSQPSEWPIPAVVDDGSGTSPSGVPEADPFASPDMPAEQRWEYEDLSPAEQDSLERAVAHVNERAAAQRLLVEAAKERAVIAASQAAQAMLGAQDLGQIGVVQ